MNRLRKNETIRNMVAETRLSASDLIMPYFVIEGKNKKEPIESMPGIYRLSIDNLVKDIEEIKDLGIKAILLFGISRKKDERGSEAYSEKGIVQRAIKEIKGEIRKNKGEIGKDKEEIGKDKEGIRDIVVITDVCLCGYTSHGHCGIVKEVDSLGFIVDSRQKKKSHKLSTINYQPQIDIAETLKALSKIAVSHAEAGADFVAPSAMMDEQVGAIRKALDEKGYQDTGILGYSAKYASNFYGPFREALDSAPQFGDRKSYQMDYRNSDEALREVEQDIEEGADIVMVKPALAYLDIIRRVKDNFNTPIAAYNVSGEYAMVKGYCQKPATSNQKPERDLVLEILTAIKRAGADLIITYHAKEVAKWLY